MKPTSIINWRRSNNTVNLTGTMNLGHNSYQKMFISLNHITNISLSDWALGLTFVMQKKANSSELAALTSLGKKLLVAGGGQRACSRRWGVRTLDELFESPTILSKAEATAADGLHGVGKSTYCERPNRSHRAGTSGLNDEENSVSGSMPGSPSAARSLLRLGEFLLSMATQTARLQELPYAQRYSGRFRCSRPWPSVVPRVARLVSLFIDGRNDTRSSLRSNPPASPTFCLRRSPMALWPS